jgi:hypothetical protein
VVASITNQSRNRPRHSASRAVASPSAATSAGVELTRERALTQKVNACIFLFASPARGQSP